MVQKQVRDIKKGEKDKAGTEVAREKKKQEFEKWKESGRPKSSEMHLEIKSQVFQRTPGA